MNRQEFLNRLEKALEGEVSPQVLQSNLQYYRNFISEEIGKGRSEAEVMEQLGDPRLIAKTIVDADEAGAENRGYYRSAEAGSQYDYRDSEPGERDGRSAQGSVKIFSSWKGALIIAAVIVVALLLLSMVFSITLRVLTSPIFWVVLAIWLIWRGVAGRRY